MSDNWLNIYHNQISLPEKRCEYKAALPETQKNEKFYKTSISFVITVKALVHFILHFSIPSNIIETRKESNAPFELINYRSSLN